MVVIAIMVMLLAILLPSLHQVRENARMTACACQLHQVGLALEMYAHAQNNWLPTAEAVEDQSSPENWWQNPMFLKAMALSPDPQGASVLTCPADCEPNRYLDQVEKECWSSYAANTSCMGMRRGGSRRGRRKEYVKRPEQALGYCDAAGRSGDHPLVVGWQPCVRNNFYYRHGNKANGLFLDGHVASFFQEEVPLGVSQPWTRHFWGNDPRYMQP